MADKDYIVTVKVIVERTFCVSAKNKKEAVVKVRDPAGNNWSDSFDAVHYCWPSASVIEDGKS